MARLEYLDPDNEVARSIRGRRGGELRPLDQMLLHSAPIAAGWNELLAAIRERTVLDDSLRELVILRVAVLNQAAYEWQAHAPVARSAGVSEEKIQALKADLPTSCFSSLETTVLAYTDELTREVAVDDAIFEALGEDLSDRELVELTMTIAAYNMVSRFLIALDIGEPPRTVTVDAWA